MARRVQHKLALSLLLLWLICPGYVQPQNSRNIEGNLLAAHNHYRAEFSVPLLAWSSKLALRSQQWAAMLIIQDRYAPRRDGIFGENLYEISGGTSTPAQVVTAWMSEAKNYDPGANACSAKCGHFTQVIWRDTRLVGCGVARNSRREVWVCNYDPPGNMVGERPY